MLILRGEIGKKQGRLQVVKNDKAQKDLELILKKWTWNKKPIKTAQDFIKNMGGWIDEQIEKDKEFENFKKRWNIKKLDEINGIELKAKE